MQQNYPLIPVKQLLDRTAYYYRAIPTIWEIKDNDRYIGPSQGGYRAMLQTWLQSVYYHVPLTKKDYAVRVMNIIDRDRGAFRAGVGYPSKLMLDDLFNGLQFERKWFGYALDDRNSNFPLQFDTKIRYFLQALIDSERTDDIATPDALDDVMMHCANKKCLMWVIYRLLEISKGRAGFLHKYDKQNEGLTYTTYKQNPSTMAALTVYSKNYILRIIPQAREPLDFWWDGENANWRLSVPFAYGWFSQDGLRNQLIDWKNQSDQSGVKSPYKFLKFNKNPKNAAPNFILHLTMAVQEFNKLLAQSSQKEADIKAVKEAGEIYLGAEQGTGWAPIGGKKGTGSGS